MRDELASDAPHVRYCRRAFVPSGGDMRLHLSCFVSSFSFLHVKEAMSLPYFSEFGGKQYPRHASLIGPVNNMDRTFDTEVFSHWLGIFSFCYWEDF
jgi:hypothetical protein